VGVTLILVTAVIICVIALWRKRQTLYRRGTTKKGTLKASEFKYMMRLLIAMLLPSATLDKLCVLVNIVQI